MAKLAFDEPRLAKLKVSDIFLVVLINFYYAFFINISIITLKLVKKQTFVISNELFQNSIGNGSNECNALEDLSNFN